MPVPQELARTGSDTANKIALGIALILLGGAGTVAYAKTRKRGEYQ